MKKGLLDSLMLSGENKLLVNATSHDKTIHLIKSMVMRIHRMEGELEGVYRDLQTVVQELYDEVLEVSEPKEEK